METTVKTEESLHKKYFVGVDEAGYGPNLGPLVVAATLWQAPAEFSEQEFYHSFGSTFSQQPWTAGCDHVPLGDSKLLYQSGNGLATLEAGLLAMLRLQTGPFSKLGELTCSVVGADYLADLRGQAWYAGFEELKLPHALPDDQEIQRLALIAGQSLSELGLELVETRAAIVSEARFNSAVAKSGSKGHLLSQVTLGLVADVLPQCATSTEVFCDRQGGRKNYLPDLLDAMPAEWFNEIAVSQARSSYQNCAARRLTVHFSVGGDRFPPTALASMLAKYLRERLMERLNAFWRKHLSDIKPTAGYPVDAKRFRQQIAEVAAQLQLPEHTWWRCK